MKANLKWAPKVLRHRRSSSFTLDDSRRSVHWISPSVFRKSVEKPNKNKCYRVTLDEVFQASSTIPPTETKGRRKHNEIGDAEHKAKRIKRKEGAKDSIILNKPKEYPMRLSFILNNDPYNVLGISPGATTSVLKNTYKKKAIETHPDKGGSKEDFIKVKTAYDILTNDKYFH